MDQELKTQLDRIENFLFEKVALNDDLSKLSERTGKLEEAVWRLTDSVDKLTIAVNKVVEDHTVLKHQMSVVQDWIREASKKIGIDFKL